MTSAEKSLSLVAALYEGKILVKIHHNSEQEFLFKDGADFGMRGWNTAWGLVTDRLGEILKNPTDWEIFEDRTMSDGYPFPWSNVPKEKPKHRYFAIYSERINACIGMCSQFGVSDVLVEEPDVKFIEISEEEFEEEGFVENEAYNSEHVLKRQILTFTKDTFNFKP